MNLRDKQAMAGDLAATVALMDKLPDIASWEVFRGAVRGQLAATTNEQTMAHLTVWAEHLGRAGRPLEIVTKPYAGNPGRSSVHVETVRDGVKVKIWSAIDTPCQCGHAHKETS